MTGVDMGKRIPIPDTTWGNESCFKFAPLALLLLPFVMLLHLGTLVRWVRNGR